jgi:hypothetical protein
VEFLSQAERNEIYAPLFGTINNSPTVGGDSFPRLRNDLVRAATAFVESAGEQGVPMLKEGVTTSHKPFRDYLLDFGGDTPLILLQQTKKKKENRELPRWPLANR